ncbi:MAG: hypothetical protein WCF67_01130 [Chitinophagaceae bacterium]
MLTVPLLQAFVKAGKVYFIRQTFNRGLKADQSSGKAFLFCHYSDIGLALTHYKNIPNDRYRRLYKWDDEKDQSDLRKAASQPAGYSIYANVLEKNWEDFINAALRMKVKNYVENRLGWTPGRNENVVFTLFPSFGELYANVRLRSREAKVKLEEIENN